MSVATVVTDGFGSFGSVNLLPTMGYGDYGLGTNTPGCVTLSCTLVHTCTLSETQIGSVTLSITCCGDC